MAERIAEHYDFRRTPGRERVVAAYDELLAALEARAVEHDAHGNREMRELVRNYMQRSTVDLEGLCQKWVESDSQGVTY
jgi:hypothetical protein